MVPTNADNSQPGGDVVWPPKMFHTRSADRSTPVPQAVQPSSNHVQRLMGIYEEIMRGPGRHDNPDKVIQWEFENLSPDDLAMIGQVYLALAQWKPNEPKETSGVTRLTPDGAGDSGDEFPGCNSVSELPAAPKMPYLAPIGRGN